MEEDKNKCRGMCLQQCSCECYDCGDCGKNANDCKCDERENCQFCEKSWEDCECDESKFSMNNIIKIHKNCVCGHRDHNGYHKYPDSKCENNCVPLLCPNDKNHGNIDNGKLYPQCILDCHGGNCIHCSMKYGYGFKHEVGLFDECCVCLEKKAMITLHCKHTLCWICWLTICDREFDDENRASCPLCRKTKF